MDNAELIFEPNRSDKEGKIRKEFFEHFQKCPIPDEELLANLGLFINTKYLSRILFMNYLYPQIIDIPGVIMEFGTRWGQNLALFSAMRGLYEPFNLHRKIIGFDTFSGFINIGEKDKYSNRFMDRGGFSTTENYEEYLDEVMKYHEQENPISHIKKYEIRKGDAVVEIDKYLAEHPETIISLAYFDLDLYEPTKKCINSIRPHLVKGSILGFDELNTSDCPGETMALHETFGLNNIKLKRYRYTSRVSYFIVD